MASAAWSVQRAVDNGWPFEPAGGWGGDHHDGVPIFVLSRREPDSEMGQWPLVTYVTDVRTAMTEAKEAAGDKNVLVHGAGTAQSSRSPTPVSRVRPSTGLPNSVSGRTSS